MKGKYLITKVSVSGKGSQVMNKRTDNLFIVRKEMATNQNVSLNSIKFTYTEIIDNDV